MSRTRPGTGPLGRSPVQHGDVAGHRVVEGQQVKVGDGVAVAVLGAVYENVRADVRMRVCSRAGLFRRAAVVVVTDSSCAGWWMESGHGFRPCPEVAPVVARSGRARPED